MGHVVHERLIPDSAVPDSGWLVTRAGLVDVNPIARLLEAHRPFIDLDADGLPDGAAHPERSGPATRLVLSHGGLEHGEVWCARADDDGSVEVAAAAVWLPPEASRLALDLHRVIARELDLTPEPVADPAQDPFPSIMAATSELIAVLRGSTAQRVLILLADDRVGPDRLDLLAELLAPVITAELAAGREAFAVTVDPAQVADLTALGFRQVLTAPLGAADLWLGAVHPALRPPPPSPAEPGAARRPDARRRGQPATATV